MGGAKEETTLKKEVINFDNVIKKSHNSIACYLADGIDKAMNKFNNK